MAHMSSRLTCASAWPCSAAIRYQRGDEYQDQFVHIDCLSSRFTVEAHSAAFTVADQVHQLIEASEADPDRGFMARTMALCSLPRSNPGNRKEYKRVNGPFTLYMYSSGQLPDSIRG